jgi:hypothetical protein
LPGTVNIKDGKGCVAVLTHCCTQDMDETTFLQITSGRRFSLKGGEMEVQTLPPKGIGPKWPNGIDRSAQDWKMCCAFFETHPGASIDEARQQLKGQFSKDHNDMATYTARTLEKSFEKVRGLLELHLGTEGPGSYAMRYLHQGMSPRGSPICRPSAGLLHEESARNQDGRGPLTSGV